MDLGYTEIEKQLQSSVRGFLQREATRGELISLRESGTTWKAEWLDTFASAGWLALAVPEELGGVGAGVTELAVVCEELGKGPVGGPFLPSSVVAASILTALDASTTRDGLLEGIAAGTAVVIPALRDPERSWQGPAGSTALITADGVSCTKVFVHEADLASHFLVSGRGDDGSPRFAIVEAASPGVSTRRLSGFLFGHFEVTLDDAKPIAVLGAPDIRALNRSLAPAYVGLAAYLAGGIRSVLEMSVEHSNTREQFGVAIGTFQRVQDHVVRILNAADAAHWCAYEAAWALDSGQATGVGHAHLAAAAAADGYWEAANAGHDVHAGIGSDPKFGLTLYTELSRSLFEYLGDPEWHRLQLAHELGWAA